jgi:peroxin-3
VEQVLEELQRQKAERLSRSVGPSEIGTSAPPSVADTTEDDGKSSIQTDGYVHASQVAIEAAGVGVGEGEGEGSAAPAEANPAPSEEKKKSKAQLWNEMKISCEHSRRDMIWY